MVFFAFDPLVPLRRFSSKVSARRLFALLALSVVVGMGRADAQATAPAHNFGNLVVSGGVSATVTFTFSASTTVSSVYVLTQGTTGLDFTRNASSPGTCTAATYANATTCTVGVQFAPRVPGARMGAIALVTSTGTVYYGQLSGTGTGSQAAIYPGTQTTVIPSSSFSGDAYGITVDANGNIYLVNSVAGTIAKYTYSGGTYAASAVGSGLSNAPGIAVDGAGNIFVADETNRRVVEEVYNPASNTYTQIVPLTTTNIPTSLAIDTAGTLYIGVGPLVEYLTANGSGGFNSAVTVYTGYNTTNGIAVDTGGNVYVNDSGNGQLFKETYSGGAYTHSTIATGLNNNNGIAVDASGIVYVSAQGTATSILRYAPSGSTYTQLASVGSFGRNNGVALDGFGNLYVTDDLNNVNTVAKVTVNGTQTLAAGNTFTTGLTYLTATLTNIGNANLPFVIPNAGYTNPTVTGGAFTYDTTNSTCPQMTSNSAATIIAPAASCTAIADFKPTAATSYTGTLAIVDNSLGGYAQQNANLTGTGVTPDTSVSLVASYSGTRAYTTVESLTANANPAGTTSGTAIFYANGVAISSAIALSSGSAHYSYTPNAGAYNYTAIVTGSGASTSSNVISLTVTQAPQTITFTQSAAPAYVGSQSILNATSSSGLAVTFSILSGPATLAGSTVTYTGTGTVVIAADQAGNANYAAAPQVTHTITVNAAPKYIITQATDTNPGTAGNCTDQNLPGATLDASCALHDAFSAVNIIAITGNYAGPTINFAPALYGQTLSVSATIGLSGNVNLAGPGPTNTVTITAASNVDFISTSTANLYTTVSGLTFAGFNDTSGGSGRTVFYLNGATSVYTFSNDIFSNNLSKSAGGVIIMSLSTSQLTISNSTFLSNSTTSPGGGVYSLGSLTVTGSTFLGNSGSSGGAIYVANATAATISGSVFGSVAFPNRATPNYGGAIISSNSPLNISNTTFIGNVAAGYGGAIAHSGSKPISITQSTFGSTATGGGNQGSYGGAVYISATVAATQTISQSNFINNKGTTGSASAGGGALFFSGGTNIGATFLVSGNNFIGNRQASTSSAGGGAIFTFRNADKNKLVLLNNLFQNNTAACGSAGYTGNCLAYGGALYGSTVNSSPTYAITGELYAGNTFIGNTASSTTTGTTAGYGGAFYLLNSYVTGYMVNNTVVSNTTSVSHGTTASYGGGYLSSAGTFSFANNIVANNTAATYPDAALSGVTSVCAAFCNSATTGDSTVNSTTTLTGLGTYGGPTIGATGSTLPTYTELPLPGSSALATGSNTYTSQTNQTCNGSTTAVDARGCGYPRQLGTLIDAGAAEANYTLAFLQQPTNTFSGTAFAPSPSVQIYETGIPFTAASGAPINFAPSASYSNFTLTPATATLDASGVATFASTPTATGPTSDAVLVASAQNSTATVTAAAVTSVPFSIDDGGATTINFISGPPTASQVNGHVGIIKVGLYAAGSMTPDTTTSAGVFIQVHDPSGGSNSYGPYAAVNGVATINLSSYTFSQTGNYIFTAFSSYTSDTATANDRITSSAPFTGFTLTGVPTSPTLGVPYTLTLTAVDSNGATYSSFTGMVTLSSSDAAAVLSPSTYTFVAADNGVHTFTVTFNTAGTRTLTATASGVANVSSYNVLDFIWLVNANGTVAKVSEAGAAVTGAVGLSTTASSLGGIAVDKSGNIWSVTAGSNTLDFVTKAGASASSFSGGGLTAPAAVAIDGAGYVWVANSGTNTVSEFKSTGAAQSTTAGYGTASVATKATGVAIDGTGGVWVTSGTGSASSLTHIVGAAAPVVTPQATAVTNGTTGVRP